MDYANRNITTVGEQLLARAEAPREPFPYCGRGDALRPMEDVVEVETTCSSTTPSMSPPTSMSPRQSLGHYDRQNTSGGSRSIDHERPHRASLTPKESLCDRMSMFFQSTTSQPGMTTRNHSESDGSFRPSPHPPAAAKTSKALPCHPRTVVRLASSVKAGPALAPVTTRKSQGQLCLVFGELDDTLPASPDRMPDSTVREHNSRSKSEFIQNVASFFA